MSKKSDFFYAIRKGSILTAFSLDFLNKKHTLLLKYPLFPSKKNNGHICTISRKRFGSAKSKVACSDAFNDWKA